MLSSNRDREFFLKLGLPPEELDRAPAWPALVDLREDLTEKIVRSAREEFEQKRRTFLEGPEEVQTEGLLHEAAMANRRVAARMPTPIAAQISIWSGACAGVVVALFRVISRSPKRATTGEPTLSAAFRSALAARRRTKSELATSDEQESVAAHLAHPH